MSNFFLFSRANSLASSLTLGLRLTLGLGSVFELRSRVEPVGLGLITTKDFFKSVGRATVNFGKKVAKNPVRALEIASKIGSPAASRNPRAALSATHDLIKFATTGEGIKVVQKGGGLYFGTKKR